MSSSLLSSSLSSSSLSSLVNNLNQHDPHSDLRSPSAVHDVFGRERHATHRDDMGGVGSFQKNSRTLYVGQLKTTPFEESEGGGGASALKKSVQKHFGEFGEIEQVNIIWRLSIAFVRYRFRLNSEFAKESMAGQSLDHGEILNIRWAYDDPNPMVQKAIQRANEDAMMAAMAAQERTAGLKRLSDGKSGGGGGGGGSSSSSSSSATPAIKDKEAGESDTKRRRVE